MTEVGLESRQFALRACSHELYLIDILERVGAEEKRGKPNEPKRHEEKRWKSGKEKKSETVGREPRRNTGKNIGERWRKREMVPQTSCS